MICEDFTIPFEDRVKSFKSNDCDINNTSLNSRIEMSGLKVINNNNLMQESI